ncbi:hypothetical protein ABIB39_004655 [Mucilaginibacter sp. UYP27]
MDFTAFVQGTARNPSNPIQGPELTTKDLSEAHPLKYTSKIYFFRNGRFHLPSRDLLAVSVRETSLAI